MEGLAVSLQGTFDTLEVTELLGILARSHKTGVLEVDTPESEVRLWLLDGRCRAVDASGASGPTATPGELQERLVAVFFEVARAESGSFRFAAGGEPPWSVAGDVAVDDALQEVHRLLHEWHEFLRVVPSMDAHPRISPELGCPSMTVDAEQWKILAGLDGTLSVNEVITAAQRPLIEVCGVLREMVELGAVEMLESGAETPRPTRLVVSGAAATPEASLADVLGDLAELAKAREGDGLVVPTRDPDDSVVADLVAGGREVEGDGAADLSPSEQPAALEGAGVEADEPAAEPAEGAEGAGVARDRGAMLRLFSAIRDL